MIAARGRLGTLPLALAALPLLYGLAVGAEAAPLPRERPALAEKAGGLAPRPLPEPGGEEDMTSPFLQATGTATAGAPTDAAGAPPPLPHPRPQTVPAATGKAPMPADELPALAMTNAADATAAGLGLSEDRIGPAIDPGRIVPALPIARPDRPETPDTPDAPDTPEIPVEKTAKPEPVRVEAQAVDVAVQRACEARLRKMGVVFKPAEPIIGSCNIAAPLSVSAVAKDVALRPEGVMNCETAEALAIWTQKSVMPAAQRELGARVTGIDQVSAFVCRTRYNRPGAKVSEHARANAVDIGGFRLSSGDRISVMPGSRHEPAARRFQAAVRKDSCTYFTTVLGPGSNAAHETHFHLDMAVRKGGYRLCELGPAPARVARDDDGGSRAR